MAILSPEKKKMVIEATERLKKGSLGEMARVIGHEATTYRKMLEEHKQMSLIDRSKVKEVI